MKHIGKVLGGIATFGVGIGLRYLGNKSNEVEREIDTHVATFAQTKYARRLHEDHLVGKIDDEAFNDAYNAGLTRYVRTQFASVTGIKQQIVESSINRRFCK